MDSFNALIALWPSVADFARDMGVGYTRAQKWQTRNSIPAGQWARLLEVAHRRGFWQITPAVLVDLAKEAA